MRIILLTAIVLCAAFQSSLAEDCEGPCVGASISIGLNDDWLIEAQPNFLTANNLQPELSMGTFFRISEELQFVGNTVVEQVVDQEPGSSAMFANFGVYQSELYADITLEPLRMKVGKFGPRLSLVAENGLGLNGDELAGTVDADESLGLEVGLDFQKTGHSQRLLATLFSLDRSFLAHSLFTTREVPRLSDGGAGNTRGISSASLVLDGCWGGEPEDCGDEGDFGYRMGVRWQRRGVQTEEQFDAGVAPADEFTMLVSGFGKFDIGETQLQFSGELAQMWNAESNPDDFLIATSAVALITENLTYSAALSHQFYQMQPSKSGNTMVELAMVYAPETNFGLPNAAWSIGGAYRFQNTPENIEEHILSLKLALEFGGHILLR